MPTRVNIHLDDDLADWMRQRAELTHRPAAVGALVGLELTMWRDHVRNELAATIWPLEQVNLIADILNGSLLSPSTGRDVYWEVQDALRQHPGAYGSKWGVDEADLITRLEGLGPTANHALALAVAAWWTTTDHQPTTEGWAAVGVRTIDTTT